MVDQTDNDIFEGDNPDEDNPSEGTLEELLSGITNEDGQQKYSDVATALKSISPAQEHIHKLESELEDLRKKVEGGKNLDDVVEQLRQEIAQAQSGGQSGGDPVDWNAKIDERLQAHEVESQLKANAQNVVDGFKQEFGEKAKEQFQKTAEANGISVELLHDMARRSPKAVFNLAGMKTQAKPVAKTHGSINSEAFVPPVPSQPERKSLMGGATTKDMVNAWRKAGETVMNQT